MKSILLFLSALIVMPSWANDAAMMPSGNSTAQAKAPALDTATSVYIELKGPAKSLPALVADLEKTSVYQEAGCSSVPTRKPGKTAKIMCTKADSALMAMLSKTAPANVHWSISVAACPTGCKVFNCPPPSGPYTCCKKTSSGYVIC